MKRILLAGVPLLLFSASQTFAAVESEMFLQAQDAMGNVSATCVIDVNTTNIVTTTGDCGSFIISSSSDHGTLTVSNAKSLSTFGGFTLVDTGVGGGDSVRPNLQAFNKIDASGAAGTITALYTDTSYTDYSPQFLIGVSSVTNLSAKADFSGFIDATNLIPATTLIKKFLTESGISSSDGGIFANPVFPTTPFSLTAQTKLTFTKAATNIQANYTINAVPEGAAVPLFGGLALVICGLIMRRKRATQE